MATKAKSYKWGLFSDYFMKILNETFVTKREAQRAFRECGYTKDSEAWIEKVPLDAKGRFHELLSCTEKLLQMKR